MFDKQATKLTASDIQSLGESTYHCLAKYMDTFGKDNVCIVTNGSASWVMDSLKMISRRYQAHFDGFDDAQSDKERGRDYWAAIYNTILSKRSITVYSAQHLYSARYPQQPTLWKTQTFKSIAKEHFNLFSSSDGNIYTMLSIGDSEEEFTASFEAKQLIATMNRLNRSNNVARLHRIKLVERPTIQQMIHQMQSLMDEAVTLRAARSSVSIQYEN